MTEAFAKRGWIKFAFDPQVLEWTQHARRAARLALSDPSLAHWHVCQGTWFVGVDALDNDRLGRVAGSQPLGGPAVAFIKAHLGGMPDLHRGQVSVVWPGYPKPREGEGEAAFRYRLNRDSAHLDGVKAVGPVGPRRRRMIDEPHAFILGLALNETDPGAAPMVVWQGSHVIMARALRAALSGHEPQDWGRVDVTQAYTQARREVFETCPRVVLHGLPGEAFLVHRLTLHGVAPWQEGAKAHGGFRMIAYFRPVLGPVTGLVSGPDSGPDSGPVTMGGIERWLDL